MTLSGPISYYESVPSTQDIARERLSGIHWTDNQTAGRGRYDRTWHASPRTSLAVSLALPSYKDFVAPYLIGMWMGLGIAEEFDLQIQWPNDLVLNGKKVAGILTEIIEGVPVVGIGLNLGPMNIPAELAIRATTLADEGRPVVAPSEAQDRLVTCLKVLPEVPIAWTDIASRWAPRDATPGKVFRLHDGQMGYARGIADSGELILDTSEGEKRVSAAEALWGTA